MISPEAKHCSPCTEFGEVLIQRLRPTRLTSVVFHAEIKPYMLIANLHVIYQTQGRVFN